MYEMKDYRPAVDAAQRIVDTWPGADAAIRRSAWIVVAHGSFELAEYPRAEQAYNQVLAVTPEGDEGRPALVDNLAASIYKQGELSIVSTDVRYSCVGRVRCRRRADPAAGLDGCG
jgi:hypothetical protein